MTLQLEIVSRSRRVLDTAVTEVRIPGVLGEMGILAGHTPVLTALGAGRLAYTEEGREHRLAVRRGLAEVGPDHVTVLAFEVLLPEEIDRESQRKTAEELAEKMKTATAEELDDLREGLQFAEACREVAGA